MILSRSYNDNNYNCNMITSKEANETRIEHFQSTNNNISEEEEQINQFDSCDTESIPSTDKKLSKNQIKKLKRKEILIEAKILKKQKIKEKKRQLREMTASDDTILESLQKVDSMQSNTTCHNPMDPIDRIKRKENELHKFKEICKNNFSVIIDCAFEDLHDERPLKSLCQQLMFSYSYNRRHINPVDLIFSGIGEKMLEQLKKCNCEKWGYVTITQEEYINLPQFQINQNDNPKQLIYLSGDAEETLDELRNDCAYIIGGIVDRNRYKGITLKKAQEQRIKAYKLPIREYAKMSGSHILTVNHVFELLLTFSKLKSWEETMKVVLPERKVTNDSKVLVQTENEQINDDNELKS